MSRYVVVPHGVLWLVTDTVTGDSFIHLTEEAARLAATDEIQSGVTPRPEQEDSPT